MTCGRNTSEKSWLGRLAAQFAIFAIVLQLLAIPFCCTRDSGFGMGGGGAAVMSNIPGAHFITICSGLQHKQLLVDENNQPVPAQPAQVNHTHCPLCTISGGSMLLAIALALLGPILRRRNPTPRPISAPVPAARYIVWPTGLAPPALSLR